MGMGPPVCGKCLLLMKPDMDVTGSYPRCFICQGTENVFGLWEFDDEHQKYIRQRTYLYETRQIVQDDLTVVATSRRPWPQGEDPNETIRPWLEENIGIQGIDWNWDMDPNNFKNLVYYFSRQEYATLFELRW